MLLCQEAKSRLQEAIAQLPPGHRTVIQLRSLDHKSFREIGKALNRSPDAARKLWVRAIYSLERQFAERVAIPPPA